MDLVSSSFRDQPMPKSILSRYLDPDVLSRVADRHLDPKGLVIGNLAGNHKSPLSGFAAPRLSRGLVRGTGGLKVDGRREMTRRAGPLIVHLTDRVADLLQAPLEIGGLDRQRR